MATIGFGSRGTWIGFGSAAIAAGATAIFENNPFERRFRDMHAVSQQAQAQFAIYEVIGRHFLGLPLQSTRII